MPPASAGCSSTRWSTLPGKHNLAELRSVQDWYLRYHLQAVPGVAEVAPLGGFVRQYQVNVDPNRLQAYNIPISKVVEAVRGGNNDVGGRLVEFTGAEYMVRGRGYAKSAADIEQDRARDQSRPACPSACATWAASSSAPTCAAASPIWTARARRSPASSSCARARTRCDVIDRVKAKLKEIEPGLPAGVKIVTAYDRSELILRSIDNLKHTLIEELIIVSIVILIFLWHVPSAHHSDHHHPGGGRSFRSSRCA